MGTRGLIALHAGHGMLSAAAGAANVAVALPYVAMVPHSVTAPLWVALDLGLGVFMWMVACHAYGRLRATWWILRMNVRVRRAGGTEAPCTVRFAGLDPHGMRAYIVVDILGPGDTIVFDTMPPGSGLAFSRFGEE